ncbi:MAG: hypothetical protein ACRD0P_10235, partial [Stackebrandtia sp.]
MRILLVGPHHRGGSIPPYLEVFTAALRRLGARVDRIGSRGVPYNPDTGKFWSADRILQAAQRILHRVDLDSYDVISLHFGNLEIEQLLPTLWSNSHRPPVVQHVHSLEPTLFAVQVPDSCLRAAVDQAVAVMDGHVYFGSYGESHLARLVPDTVPRTVAWLPTTIPPGQRTATSF